MLYVLDDSHSEIRSTASDFFFFNDTATTEIYTLSLHDALPISHRRVAVSAAARSLAADSGLGYLAGHGAQARVRSLPLRALALLEGVRHRGRRRPAGPPHQRHDVHVGDQDRKSTRLNSSHLVIS